MSMSNEADSWWSKRRKILAHFSSEYMYLAGCHGLARGMQKNGSWPRRLLWFAIAFAAMAVMLYQCTLLIQQFRRNEIQVCESVGQYLACLFSDASHFYSFV